MDGTLVDTEPYWIAAEYALVESFGGTWSDEHAHALVGNALIDSAAYIREHGGVELELTEIVDRLLVDVVAATEREIPWRPGARELLAEVVDHGVPCALVTMSYTELARTMTDQLPEGSFAAVVTGDQVTDGKPHPEAYLTAMQRLGVERGRQRRHRGLADRRGVGRGGRLPGRRRPAPGADRGRAGTGARRLVEGTVRRADDRPARAAVITEILPSALAAARRARVRRHPRGGRPGGSGAPDRGAARGRAGPRPAAPRRAHRAAVRRRGGGHGRCPAAAALHAAVDDADEPGVAHDRRRSRARTASSASPSTCPAATGCSPTSCGATIPPRRPGSRCPRSSNGADVPCAVVLPAAFAGSGLTAAAYRGARFVGLGRPTTSSTRCWRRCARRPGWCSGTRRRWTPPRTCTASPRRSGRRPPGSPASSSSGWSPGLPADAALLVTADHGGLDVPIELAPRPRTGRPAARRRAGRRRRTPVPLPAHRAGRRRRRRAAWHGGARRRGAGVSARRGRRRRACSARCAPAHLARIGDVVAVCEKDTVMLASGHEPPEVGRLVGFHGALHRRRDGHPAAVLPRGRRA